MLSMQLRAQAPFDPFGWLGIMGLGTRGDCRRRHGAKCVVGSWRSAHREEEPQLAARTPTRSVVAALISAPASGVCPVPRRHVQNVSNLLDR